ncbi:hypothetical protein MBLNU459_g6033t1 [Dothideomycetes sp. NU459]
MPTEQEDLVEFLHHGNTQIRQIAVENLVAFSTAQPSLFKHQKLTPVTDLKLLVKDYKPIAKNALTILINISEDQEILNELAPDDGFVEELLSRITNPKEPNADEIAMLLANLTKSDHMTRLLTLERATPKPLSTSPVAIDQLLDLFVKGAERSYNVDADFDYLCYLFADLSKHAAGRKHFLTPRAADQHIVPLSKLVVFTEAKSVVRRRGVASAIKNAAFETDAHARLLSADDATGGVNLLPYLLLPLMGPEEYADDDTDGMLDDLQLLPPDKAREPENDIVLTHLETLLLLTTTRPGRDRLRDIKVYPIIRELHLQTDDDDVREACDRFVQVIMRDEEGEGEDESQGAGGASAPRQKVVEVDEDDELVEIV